MPDAQIARRLQHVTLAYAAALKEEVSTLCSEREKLREQRSEILATLEVLAAERDDAVNASDDLVSLVLGRDVANDSEAMSSVSRLQLCETELARLRARSAEDQSKITQLSAELGRKSQTIAQLRVDLESAQRVSLASTKQLREASELSESRLAEYVRETERLRRRTECLEDQLGEAQRRLDDVRASERRAGEAAAAAVASVDPRVVQGVAKSQAELVDLLETNALKLGERGALLDQMQAKTVGLQAELARAREIAESATRASEEYARRNEVLLSEVTRLQRALKDSIHGMERESSMRLRAQEELRSAAKASARSNKHHALLGEVDLSLRELRSSGTMPFTTSGVSPVGRDAAVPDSEPRHGLWWRRA